MLGRPCRMTVRVYYEDTDFSGRVYHASYVRFFERGRTEWLRETGLAHRRLAALGVAFAVTSLQVDFSAAAYIDDALDVITEMRELRGAVIVFRQRIERQNTQLASATVEAVAIKGDRATRPPRELLEALRGEAVGQGTPPSP